MTDLNVTRGIFTKLHNLYTESGYGLDVVGEFFNIARDGMIDVDYRKRIISKINCIHETLNSIEEENNG